MKKNMIFKQNEKNLHIIILFKSFHPPSLNALCCLLEHQYMCPPFVIAAYESLSVKRWISKSHSHCWKGFKYAEDAGKPKNVQELEDYSEEQLRWTVQSQRGTHEQLSQHRKTVVDHQKATQIIKIQGRVNFWTGSFFMNSVIILSCGVYINICYVK